jgi:hypothetical protein
MGQLAYLQGSQALIRPQSQHCISTVTSWEDGLSPFLSWQPFSWHSRHKKAKRVLYDAHLLPGAVRGRELLRSLAETLAKG